MTPQARSRRMARACAVAAISLSAIALTACQRGANADPSPAASSTVSVSPTSTPSEEQVVDRAIEQFKRTQAETLRLSKLGGLGPNEPATSLEPMVTGKPLQDYTAGLRSVKAKKIVWVSGEQRVWDVKPVPTAKGALVTISACTDGTHIVSEVGSKKKRSTGVALRSVVSYKMDQTVLKMYEYSGKEDKACVAK